MECCDRKKLKEAQCSEPVKSRVASIGFLQKKSKIFYGSCPRAKGRHQGPMGSLRAQPCYG